MASTSEPAVATAAVPAPGSEPLAVVATPTSPSSGLALSRFEFETGKANEGTKILMVEWDGSAGRVRDKSGGREGEISDWDVSWEGKTPVLRVVDRDTDGSSDTRRVYFLLPPGAMVPKLITITHKTNADKTHDADATAVLRTTPMPAIFPAELGGGDEAGRRGVLHTIWAKKRLAELDAEIADEMKENGESVGLEMAAQERQWIVDHFGLGPGDGVPAAPTLLQIPQNSISPASPRSPIGGRLGEKLRGLKLATSPTELAAATQASKSTQTRAQPPLATVKLPKDTGNGAVASLDAIVGAKVPPVHPDGTDDNGEGELFALPMSPRSPEMKRSPFSLL
ncbi:hypothetical protein OQA88_10372 [Cercophora sp. LCS_1]